MISLTRAPDQRQVGSGWVLTSRRLPGMCLLHPKRQDTRHWSTKVPNNPPAHKEPKTTFPRDNHIPNPRRSQQVNTEEAVPLLGEPHQGTTDMKPPVRARPKAAGPINQDPTWCTHVKMRVGVNVVPLYQGIHQITSNFRNITHL